MSYYYLGFTWSILDFLLGKFHGQRSLVDYSPWGHKELDMTERLSMQACKQE